jgi:hypothetical protein
MTVSRTTKFTLAAVLGLGLAATAIPANATGNFDGKWSVVVVTTKGDCDRAYRYPIAIQGATLVNAGDAAFDISGHVQGNGSVAVKISYGDKSAHGLGRLSGGFGQGSWTGGSCAGTWTAERRS